MRKVVLSIFFGVMFVVAAVAQTIPQTMSYQAVVRDAQGEIVADKQVSVEVSILKNNELGDVVYTESHSVKTNANGLMTLAIGTESSFLEIDWADGPYYMKTETTVDGATIEAVSQLMAVPYAKYAETAGNMDEYVKKSEIDDYIEAKVRSMFKEAYENASVMSDDPSVVMSETIKDVASDGLEKSFSTGDDTDLLGTMSESGGRLYRALSSSSDNWGVWNVFWAVLFYGKDAVDELMEENLASDFDTWESSASIWYGGEDNLMDSLAQWTEEDYETWSEIARDPDRLGDDAVDEILTALLEEDWDTYEQFADDLDDNGASVYEKVSSRGVNADGSIEGEFAVSETKKVKFSRGNVQYQASTNTWRFAEYQFDAVGGYASNKGTTAGNVYVNGVKSDNVNASNETYNGWIDLFCYGTSGWSDGETEYKPTMHTGDSADYVKYSLDGDYRDADWGIYNSIVNGGNVSGQWRTLTKDEWNYIYSKASSEGRFTMATIKTQKVLDGGAKAVVDVKGFVLLPDNWSGGYYDSKYVQQGFEAVRYTEGQWFSMQAKGAVFFPASGVLKVKNGQLVVASSSTYASYWTSTICNEKGEHAYWFTVDVSGSGAIQVQQQGYSTAKGLCVRVVKDIE